MPAKLLQVQIQPYFPEPIQVRGNVAAERYIVTLSFIRAVMAGHFISVMAIVGVAVLLEPVLTLRQSGLVFLASLLALTLVRRFVKGGMAENALSLLLQAPTVWSLGTAVRLLADAGAPVWIVLAAYALACAYGALCGRDFSFVGQFAVTTIALAITLPVVCLAGWIGWGEAAAWGLIALAYVLFFVYDLAALLSRRRLGEEPAAVADLYRDLLNFATYSVRVFLHWRRFKFV